MKRYKGHDLPMRKSKVNNTTITLSIPSETKDFLDALADDGYNRSALMIKMMGILYVLYYNFPSIPLPRGIERLNELVRDGLLLHEFTDGHLNPPISDDTRDKTP